MLKQLYNCNMLPITEGKCDIQMHFDLNTFNKKVGFKFCVKQL